MLKSELDLAGANDRSGERPGGRGSVGFRDRTAGAVFIAALLTGVAVPAYGYTDPGSGLMIWQILGAAALGGVFYVKKLFWRLRRKPQQDEVHK